MNFANKVAVVTGATRGLGFALAQQLGARGAQVVALARTVGGLEALDDSIQKSGGPKAVLVPIDLTSAHDQIDRLGATLHERFGRIDIFIHAAAMLGTLGPLAHGDPNEVQRVMNVNAVSAYRFYRSFDALMRGGTVVAIDCALGDDSTAYWGPYRASKAALRVFTETYARESGVRALLPCPAAFDSKLYRAAYPGGDAAALSTVEVEAEKIIQMLPA